VRKLLFDLNVSLIIDKISILRCLFSLSAPLLSDSLTHNFLDLLWVANSLSAFAI